MTGSHILVQDGRTLRSLERAGMISEPPESLRPKGRKWGAGYCYVDAFTKKSLRHNGRRFSIRYRDGCLLPFVYEQRDDAAASP